MCFRGKAVRIACGVRETPWRAISQETEGGPMAAQILATIIFLIMFGFIITEKAPRHLETLV